MWINLSCPQKLRWHSSMHPHVGEIFILAQCCSCGEIPKAWESLLNDFCRISIFGSKKEYPPYMGIFGSTVNRTIEPSIHMWAGLSTVFGGLSTEMGKSDDSTIGGACLYMVSRINDLLAPSNSVTLKERFPATEGSPSRFGDASGQRTAFSMTK